MAREAVYCLISGCIPGAGIALLDVFGYDYDPDPLVIEAIADIVTDDEIAGMDDVTVVGAIDEDGEPTHRGQVTKEDALGVDDSDLRAIPSCRPGAGFYSGSVDGPADNRIAYPVAHGTNIMVQSCSLLILRLATRNRVTAKRLWRLAMFQGRSMRHGQVGLDKVDYGEIQGSQKLWPLPLPGMSHEAFLSLAYLRNKRLIRDTIIHRGRYWIWMRPDRFPFEHDSKFSTPPSVLSAPFASISKTKLECLPFELISMIASHTPFPTLLVLAASSRSLRFQLLAFEVDRNTLAHTWMQRSAPWFCPVSQHEPYKPSPIPDSWQYLARCFHSGSMRNRKRIWKIAEQIEDLADGCGV